MKIAQRIRDGKKASLKKSESERRAKFPVHFWGTNIKNAFMTSTITPASAPIITGGINAVFV